MEIKSLKGLTLESATLIAKANGYYVRYWEKGNKQIGGADCQAKRLNLTIQKNIVVAVTNG